MFCLVFLKSFKWFLLVIIGNSVNFSLDDYILTSVNFVCDGITAYIFCFYQLFKIFQVVFIGNSVNFFLDDFVLTSFNFS